MNNLTEISTAEWEVMKVIWSLDEATSRSVGKILKEKQNWETPTTKTLLGRLVKKGYLNTEKVGNYFIYHPTITENNGSIDRVKDAISSICSRKVGKAISEIITSNELSTADLQLINDALNNKEFVEDVKCMCLDNCTCAKGECNCQ